MRMICWVVIDLKIIRPCNKMYPVIEAMERNAVLLLDEIDLASNKIMCLQPILEVQVSMLKRLTSLLNLRLPLM